MRIRSSSRRPPNETRSRAPRIWPASPRGRGTRGAPSRTDGTGGACRTAESAARGGHVHGFAAHVVPVLRIDCGTVRRTRPHVLAARCLHDLVETRAEKIRAGQCAGGRRSRARTLARGLAIGFAPILHAFLLRFVDVAVFRDILVRARAYQHGAEHNQLDLTRAFAFHEAAFCADCCCHQRLSQPVLPPTSTISRSASGRGGYSRVMPRV